MRSLALAILLATPLTAETISEEIARTGLHATETRLAALASPTNEDLFALAEDVLLHRMRLFDVMGLLNDQPIFAWSAGAMAMGDRVVLFHDSPPHGVGNAELFEEGLGAYHGVLPLPHAKKRLHLALVSGRVAARGRACRACLSSRRRRRPGLSFR